MSATVTNDEGWIIDTATGEVVGHSQIKPEFRVTDLASAEWVLERMSECDGAVVGLEARKAALCANIDKQINKQSNRRAYLENKFYLDLQDFAEAELKGKKERSIVTPFGTIGMRTNPGSIRVLNDMAAMAFCIEHAPDAIKTVPETKSVLVSKLKDVRGLPVEAFDVMDPYDKFYIKTGVKGE